VTCLCLFSLSKFCFLNLAYLLLIDETNFFGNEKAAALRDKAKIQGCSLLCCLKAAGSNIILQFLPSSKSFFVAFLINEIGLKVFSAFIPAVTAGPSLFLFSSARHPT